MPRSISAGAIKRGLESQLCDKETRQENSASVKSTSLGRYSGRHSELTQVQHPASMSRTHVVRVSTLQFGTFKWLVSQKTAFLSNGIRYHPLLYRREKKKRHLGRKHTILKTIYFVCEMVIKKSVYGQDSNEKKCFRKHRQGSVVCHIAGSSTELGIGLNDLIYSFQEILLSSNFSPCSDGKHTSFCADASNLSTSAIWTQSC